MDTRHVVITGVSRGLGRSLVERMIRAGLCVHGCARSGAPLQELVDQHGPPHSFTRVDVSDDNSVKEWARRTTDSVGPPDLIVNNAAIINPNAVLWEVSGEDFSRVVDVNIKGVANVVRHFAPQMIRRGSGVIVNISSGWGRSVSAEVAPYCATKWAIEGLTMALAEELPDGMASVTLNPGVIDTQMLRSCFGSEAARYPDPEEWADKAAPFILAIDHTQSGEALTVPW